MEFSGFCIGVLIGMPIGAVVWWFVLAMCASAARADKANEEATKRQSWAVIDHERKYGK